MAWPARGLPLLLAAAALLAPTGCAGDAGGLETLRIAGETFRLELAADPASRRRGLMGRASLAEDGGMLFVFPRARPRSFWMGHCLIDIDAIFLDGRGRVTATHAMRAEPPQGPEESDGDYRRRMPDYASNGPAQYVIELRGGTLPRLGLRVGDPIELDRARLSALAR